MPQLLKEGLNGGLVTARDPSTFLEGELQQADDCIYRPADIAIHRAPGRTAYGTVFSSSIIMSADGSTTAITSSSAFGTEIASCVITVGSDQITKAGSGLITASAGDSVWGPGIPVGAVVLDKEADNETVRISAPATATSTSTCTFSDFHKDDTIVHAGLPDGTKLASITDASNATTDTASDAASASTAGVFTRATKGLQYLNFEENNDLLIVYAGTTLYSSSYTAATGTFSSLKTGLTHEGTETLDVLHFRERYLLLTGTNPNQVVDYTVAATPAPQIRAQGMAPVSDFASAATTTGTWSSLLGTGVWWFLVTEVLDPGGEDSADLNQDNANTVESAYTGEAKSVEITDIAAEGVLITRRTALFNDGTKGLNSATHWRVYMSTRQEDTQERPSISTFTLVATVPIGSTTAKLTDDNTDTAKTACTVVNTDWADSGNLDDVDGTFAHTSVDNGIAELHSFTFDVAAMANNTITGILVEVFGLKFPHESNRYIDVQLVKDYDGSEVTSSYRRLVMEGGSISFRLATGSRYDGWDVSGGWSAGTGAGDSDFENGLPGNFAVRLRKPATAKDEAVRIDGVRVTVYAGGTTINNNGKPYDIVVLDDGLGNLIPFPANMPPPASDTGDVFQGQVVLNDVDSPADIVYSPSGKLDAFPSLYRVTFESKLSDKVRMIRRLGTHLIVGLRSGIKRVNYLPVAQDADFQAGRAFYDVSTTLGVVGPHAATMFDMPGVGPIMGFISYNGLHLTDGITTRPLNEDLDWVNTISESELDTAVLINDPKNYMLIMYYTPTGGAAHTKALYFYYHPVHIKQGGKLPATGPITVSAASATAALLAGVPKTLTGHGTDGKVYLEDNGTSDASGGTLNPTIRTRLIYPFEVGGQAKMERLWIRGSATDGDFDVASCTVTADSDTVTSAGGFGSVVVGTMVTGTGIEPGVYVTASSASSITLSRDAIASGTVTLTFHNGVVHTTIRFQNIDTAVTAGELAIFDTDKAALQVAHVEAFGEAFELKFEKPVSINNAMRLHYWAALIEGAGLESNQTEEQS